jgi:hypothetical protein
MIPDGASVRIRKELLVALESARTRLAIVMAAESKSTPVDRWRYYLETTNRICRLSKRLRDDGQDGALRMNNWIHILNALRQIPVQDKAGPLCQVLEDIIAELE